MSFAAALALCLPILLAPQGGFDPAREFEGFAECERSEFAALYALEAYRAELARVQTEAELAALRRRWSEDRQRVARELELVRTDPAERALFETRRRVPAGSLLARMRWQRLGEARPFQLLFERGSATDTSLEQPFVDAHAAWLAELGRLWLAEYALPLKLERRPAVEALSVFVLRGPEAYVQHFAGRPSSSPFAPYARFDPELGALVTYAGPKQTQDRLFLRRALLEAATRQLLWTWAGRALVLPPWLELGFPEYLTAARGQQPGGLAMHPPDPVALEMVGNFVGLPGGIDAFLLPIAELVALRDEGQAVAHLRTRSGVVTPQPGDGFEHAVWYVQAQASLVVWYLQHGAEKKHRALFLELLDRALRGELESTSFADTFGAAAEPLELEYRKWLQPTLREVTGFNLPIAGPPQRAKLVSAPVVKRLDVKALAPDPNDPESLLARALLRARGGACETAARELETALAKFEGDARARAERELQRLRDFTARRRAFFEALAAPGARKLEFGEGPARVFAQVTGVDARVVRLGENKRGVSELVLEELELLPLAEVMRDKKYAFDAGASVAYAYVLAQDARWKKLLTGSDPAVVALRADAERDYPARFALVRALELLEALAADGVPADADEAVLTMTRLEELAGQRALPQVARQRALLAELARVALGLRFVSDGLASRLAARCEVLPEGRIALHYSFDASSELLDWEQNGYLDSHAWGRARHDFQVDGGRLVTTAFACLRHVLAFEGPQVTRCRLRFSEPAGAHDPRYTFLLGLNDDGQQSYAASDAAGGAYVRDRETNYVRDAPPATGILLGETYALEFRFDGESYTASVNRKPVASAEAGARRTGHPILFSSADYPLQVEELTLEGKPAAESLATLRTGWVEERLRGLGF